MCHMAVGEFRLAVNGEKLVWVCRQGAVGSTILPFQIMETLCVHNCEPGIYPQWASVNFPFQICSQSD